MVRASRLLDGSRVETSSPEIAQWVAKRQKNIPLRIQSRLGWDWFLRIGFGVVPGASAACVVSLSASRTSPRYKKAHASAPEEMGVSVT